MTVQEQIKSIESQIKTLEWEDGGGDRQADISYLKAELDCLAFPIQVHRLCACGSGEPWQNCGGHSAGSAPWEYCG